jgi:hypothetical protein
MEKKLPIGHCKIPFLRSKCGFIDAVMLGATFDNLAFMS